jgi:hypothetical protein
MVGKDTERGGYIQVEGRNTLSGGYIQYTVGNIYRNS